ncbi:MAG: AAA family ATPase [Gammaproteobacteria bacterium]
MAEPAPRLFLPANNLRDFLAILWRRRMLIVAVVALVVAVGAVYVGNLTSYYTATATVIVEDNTARVVDLKQVVQGRRRNTFELRGELEVLRSRSLAQRVVEKIGLEKNAYFNASLRPPAPFLDTLNPIDLARKVYRMAFPQPRVEPANEEARARRVRRGVVDVLLESLSIKQVTAAPVIHISITTPDPSLSAHVANTLAESYVIGQLEAKFETTRQATQWLSERLDGLRQKVLDSERAVAEFKASNELVAGRGATLTEQKLSELNSQYIMAQTSRAEAQASYDQARRVIKDGNSLDAAQTLGSRLIDTLLVEEAGLQRQVAELDERYGVRHPKMIKARSELKDIRGKIRAEVRKVVTALGNKLEVARSRERSLRQALEGARGEAAEQGTASVTLRELERQAETDRLLYENFLGRFKETRQQQDIQQADARILSEAVPPSVPSRPHKALIIVLMFFSALGGAVAVVMVAEGLDVGIRGADQVERLTGLDVLTMVPAVRVGRKERIDRYVLDKPESVAAEAVRNLYTSLRLTRLGGGVHRVCVTSTLSGEGKSTLSVWLGRIAASQGRRVLLLDCDLRRAQVHRILGVANDKNLADLLLDDATLEEVRHVDEETGLHFIPGKELKGNSLYTLTSGAFSDLLQRLESEYDLVILDAPPVLAVSDTKVLAKMADSCVYLVRWDSTDRKAMVTGLRALEAVDAKVLGIAVTRVDIRRHTSYAYGDYGHYYGRYSGYYSDKS